MVELSLQDRSKEQGFTLVELAVVMIIIGLLIGGILKGQELIANAELAATVSQVKGIDAAVSSFRDKYSALPGDMRDADDRLANCGAGCNVADGATVGDGILTSAFNAAPSVEGRAFFLQLNAADLLGGLDTARGAVWGGEYPESSVGGGFHAASFPGAALPPNALAINGNDVRAGLYLALHGSPNGGVANTGVITPNQTFRIDRKLDDGAPDAGSVFPAGAALCVQGTTYNEDTDATNCNVYIRIQS